MALGGTDVTVGVSGKAKAGDARKTGKEAAKEAMKNAGKNGAPAYFYMAAPLGEDPRSLVPFPLQLGFMRLDPYSLTGLNFIL